MNEIRRPKVSVIIPCYNHEKFIGTAISSVLNQTYKDYEVIVADNGSTDRSGEIIKSFEDSVRIITLKENNPILCQKLLWEAARGEYMAELCSDDYWYPEKLEKQVKATEEHKEFQIFFTWAVITAEDLLEITDDKRFAWTNRSRYKWIETMFHNGNVFELSSIMIKNDGRFEKYYKDVSVFRQLPDTKLYLNMAFEEEIYVVEEYLVKHRMHGNNVSSPNPQVTARALNEQIFLMKDIWERLKGEEFLRAFDEENLTAVWNEAEITAEKTALLLKFARENKQYINLYSDAALDYMFRHYYDEGVSKILEHKYGISLEQAWQYSGEMGTGKLIRENLDMIDALRKSKVKQKDDLVDEHLREMAEGLYQCNAMILENSHNRALRQELGKAVETSLDVTRELCLNDPVFDMISLEQIEKNRNMLYDIDDDDIWKELMEMIALISHGLEEYNCRRRLHETDGGNGTADFKGEGYKLSDCDAHTD